MNREREFIPHVREEKGILQGPLHPGDSPSWKNRLEPGNPPKFTGRTQEQVLRNKGTVLPLHRAAQAHVTLKG